MSNVLFVWLERYRCASTASAAAGVIWNIWEAKATGRTKGVWSTRVSSNFNDRLRAPPKYDKRSLSRQRLLQYAESRAVANSFPQHLVSRRQGPRRHPTDDPRPVGPAAVTEAAGLVPTLPPPTALGAGRQAERGNVVCRHLRILRTQHHALERRLCDQHPVERIAVVPGQIASMFRMLAGDRQQGETMRRDGTAYLVAKAEPAGRALDRNFPNRCGADESLVSLVSDRGKQQR